MDLATIVIVDAVLSEGGIRAAAARCGRAPSSVSAAVKRFEQALSMPLFRREETVIVLTLEARARAPAVREAMARIAAILDAAGREPAEPAPRSASSHSTASSGSPAPAASAPRQRRSASANRN